MTILIYEYKELEERASKHLRTWKVWHIILYVLAAIFGVLNYTFLFQMEELVSKQCIFYPRLLEFHWVEVPTYPDASNVKISVNYTHTENASTQSDTESYIAPVLPTSGETVTVAQTTTVPSSEKAKVVKREGPVENVTNEEISVEENDAIMVIENTTHRFMLNLNRSLFLKETSTGCQFAEYMPLMSTVIAIVWTTLFMMCPSGGRTRTGLQEPWSILAPAFVFAFVMVILTGYSFTSTNGGLQAFCAAFYNFTNTTTCSAVNPFIEVPANTSWSVGGHIAATRAASAGVWASWACACALLLARCLTGPDFLVKHTTVHLVRDPQQKVTPFLQKQKSPHRSQRSSQNSPSKRDTISMRSDPTVTTELVTASVEHEGHQNDSQPTSVAMTPLKESRGEQLEMTVNPQERRYHE